MKVFILFLRRVFLQEMKQKAYIAHTDALKNIRDLTADINDLNKILRTNKSRVK